MIDGPLSQGRVANEARLASRDTRPRSSGEGGFGPADPEDYIDDPEIAGHARDVEVRTTDIPGTTLHEIVTTVTCECGEVWTKRLDNEPARNDFADAEMLRRHARHARGADRALDRPTLYPNINRREAIA